MSVYWVAALCYIAGQAGWTGHGVWVAYQRSKELHWLST